MEDWHFNIYVKTSVNQAMAVAIAKSLEQVIMGRQKMIRTFKDDAQPVGHNGIDIKIDGVKFLHELTANWPEQKDLLENINEPPNGVKH